MVGLFMFSMCFFILKNDLYQTRLYLWPKKTIIRFWEVGHAGKQAFSPVPIVLSFKSQIHHLKYFLSFSFHNNKYDFFSHFVKSSIPPLLMVKCILLSAKIFISCGCFSFRNIILCIFVLNLRIVYIL